MSITLAPATDAPLSLLLFSTAMTREQSVSQFAQELAIGTLSLRQFILANTQRPRQKTLEAIGNALGISADEVRERNERMPYAQPAFSTWLTEQIASRPKYTRARLVRETEISDSAVRNYLAGKTLPDAHQAARIARALEVDPDALAAIIVASMIVEEGGTLAAAPPPVASPEPEPASTLTVSLNHPAVSPAPLFASDSNPELEFAPSTPAPSAPAGPASALSHDEAQLLSLWRQLHPQARRATYSYIAMLLVER